MSRAPRTKVGPTQWKALVEAFSLIVKTDGSFAAPLNFTICYMFRRSGVSVQVPAAPSAETVAGGGEAERARERQHERRLRRRGTLSNR